MAFVRAVHFEEIYGQPMYFLEMFVDPQRFRGHGRMERMSRSTLLDRLRVEPLRAEEILDLYDRELVRACEERCQQS